MSDTPAEGHNLPDLSEILSADLMAVLIGNEIEPLKERADELIASCRRFSIAHPSIGSDETDALAAQVLATCQRFVSKSGRVETARTEFLKPIREASTAVGSYERGPFAAIVQAVNKVTNTISAASIKYKQEKEAAERKRRQAEADRLAHEAVLTEQLATQGSKTVSLDEAVVAAEAAEQAQEAANARPADLTRSHGDLAGTSSLRYKRIVTIVEATKVDRIYCVPDLSLLTRAAGKAGDPLPIIAGCSVSDVPDLTVRR